MRLSLRFACLLFAWSISSAGLHSAEPRLHTYDVRNLTDIYFSEGANAADINRDGHVDVIYGPHWYEGPDFKKGHAFYPAKPQPMNRYANSFFTWPYDFDGDGWTDLLVVGLPGTPAYLYENPGGKAVTKLWTKHQVFDAVGNESPQLTNLVGDEKPELVCTYRGMFGYVSIDWEKPFETWKFTPISGRVTAMRFGHGLGIGDINGDGRMDVISAGGWIEQPKDHRESLWKAHVVKFSNSYGGAEMYAYDVDGDSDNDVITSLAAHDFGLAWYEQQEKDGKRTFKEHLIMGARKDQNRYGVVFSELHSVALADMDGDGLKDIVTGKTYYSHHEKSPQWNAGAVVYWFKLKRTKSGVDWIPWQAAKDTGIGRQITIADVNADKIPDIVVGGMKGGNVLIQQRHSVSQSEWDAMQPQPHTGKYVRLDRGRAAKFEKNHVPGAIEGESLKVLRVSTGKVGTQKMAKFRKGRWSGDSQLFWSSAKPRARLDLEFSIPKSGRFDIEAQFTTAKDYAIINVLLDNKALGEPLDLFDYPDVRTTGILTLDQRQLKAGKHKLTLETIGANESAVKKYMVGLDFLRLVPR